MKNIASVIGGAAVIAAAAISMTSGLTPASAAPTPSGAILNMAPDSFHPENYVVAVWGVLPMSEHDANGFIINLNTGKRPGGMRYEILGDDGDSTLRGVTPSRWYPGAGLEPDHQLYASSDGIHYRAEFSVPKAHLNEDDGVFNDGDEIYARAIFVDADGAQRDQFSAVQTGNF